MSEEENNVSDPSEDDNSEDDINEDEEVFSSENEEEEEEMNNEELEFLLNNALVNNPLTNFRSISRLIHLENLIRERDDLHLNPEELASLAPPDETEYLGEFNEEEEPIKIDLNKRYTLPSCKYFDRRIVMYPGTEIPLIIRHSEEINSIILNN